MSVRDIPSSHGRHIVCKYPAVKMGRMIRCESLIELDCALTLDYEEDIVAFEEQPLTIEYRCGGVTLQFTPDFHPVYSDGHNALIECKPKDLVDTDENRRKIRAGQEWCAEYGWDFIVATDEKLRKGYRLANIWDMRYYARIIVPPQVVGRVCAVLMDAPAEFTVGDLAKVLSPHNLQIAMPTILHLAFHHKVQIPIDVAPISMGSLISLPVSC